MSKNKLAFSFLLTEAFSWEEPMNKKKLMIVIGFIFVLAMIILLSNRGTLPAQECRIILIHGLSEIMIEPETKFLSKGDCVVWFNRFTAEDVKVTFQEGKKCSDVTNTPMGFSLNAQGCYVTSWIPFAGTSSLRFMEKGTYEYTVEAKIRGGVKAKGRIVVE
jgi:hypothetical protein